MVEILFRFRSYFYFIHISQFQSFRVKAKWQEIEFVPVSEVCLWLPVNNFNSNKSCYFQYSWFCKSFPCICTQFIVHPLNPLMYLVNIKPWSQQLHSGIHFTVIFRVQMLPIISKPHASKWMFHQLPSNFPIINEPNLLHNIFYQETEKSNGFRKGSGIGYHFGTLFWRVSANYLYLCLSLPVQQNKTNPGLKLPQYFLHKSTRASCHLWNLEFIISKVLEVFSISAVKYHW